MRRRLGRWLAVSLWPIPAAFVLAAVALGLLLPLIDEAVGGTITVSYTSSAATEVLSSIAAGMIAFTGFVFAIVLLLVQFGSSQYSPRLLRGFIRDPVPKTAIGTFAATFIYSLFVLAGVGTQDNPGFVPDLSVTIAIALVAISVFVFLWLLNHVYQQLRVGNIVRTVAREGRRAIDLAYPEPVGEERGESWSAAAVELGEPTGVIGHLGEQGILTVAKRDVLAELATRSGAVVALVPAVGDSVPTGAPLFFVYGDGELDPGPLRAALEFGVERTIEGDPAQALRWLVDIALKALSPAVNDPTTALQAIDQIEDLLCRLGTRRISAGELCDRSGSLRLVYRTPSWEDYVDLAVTEIRRDGAGSVQVERRLRAFLLDLLEVVPERRRLAVNAQLARLDETVKATFAEGERAVAEVADYQGIGSRRAAGRRAAREPGGLP